MGADAPDEFDSLLADLEPDEFVAFVADLWAARGMETTTRGDVVLGSPGNDADPVRIVVCYRRRLLRDRLPFAGAGSVAKDDLADVDVLVSNTDRARLRTVAEATNTGYVGPERLRTLTRYAVDRETREQLFGRYFDRPVDATRDAESVLDRVVQVTDRNREDRAIGRVGIGHLGSDRETVRTVAPVAVVALVFVLAMIAATGSLDGVPASVWSSSGLDDERRGTEGPAGGYPPGLNRSGLADPAPLVAAHRTVVDGRSYRLTIRHAGTRGLVVTAGRWRESRQRVLQRSPGRYRYTVDGTLPPETLGGSPRTVRFGLDARDSGCTSWTLEYGLKPPDDPCTIVNGGSRSFAAVTAQYLARYLGGNESTVRACRAGSRTQYRLVVTDPPARMARPATNYTAVALVDESGLVREFSVTYETPLVDHPRASFSFRFGGVSPPTERRSNGTASMRTGACPKRVTN